MLRALRRKWMFPLVIATYVCLDFSSPFLPGAFVFDADQPVDGVLEQERGVAAVVPTLASAPNVAPVVDIPPTLPPQPRSAPSAAWVVVLRRSSARSSARSALSDGH